jgi:hypothetical protein
LPAADIRRHSGCVTLAPKICKTMPHFAAVTLTMPRRYWAPAAARSCKTHEFCMRKMRFLPNGGKMQKVLSVNRGPRARVLRASRAMGASKISR